MSQDTLSDVLRTVRLRGAVFYYVTGNRQWAAEAPPSRAIAAAVMPDAEHVIEYHVVVAGQCWAALVGEAPVRMSAGDVVMVPQGDPHVMSSAPGMRADPNVSWYYETKVDQLPFAVAYDGLTPPASELPRSGADTTLVCGFLGCDVRPFNPLVATLPRMLHLSAQDGSGWITQFMQHAVAESDAKRPGGEAMLARMSEMMFVDAVRRFVDRLPPESTGWLAGLRDRYVGRTLALMHERPSEDWTIDDLSREVGLSRSALHQRFVQLVEQPPMQYLANWRMQIAAGLLRNTNANVATIALEVGYDSEAAFARAFKRLVGVPPATWRRGKRQQDEPVSLQMQVAARDVSNANTTAEC
ncbi:MAG: AraC family transcriptional regulator [Burkholderiales bacterium]